MTASVIGVRFREAARIYHFAEPDYEVHPGEYVIVETNRGLEMARVVTVPERPGMTPDDPALSDLDGDRALEDAEAPPAEAAAALDNGAQPPTSRPAPPDNGDQPSRPPPPADVRPIVRLATGEDRDRASEMRGRADEVLEHMRQTVVRDGLEISMIAVQLNLRGSDATVFFQAADHIDFRPVVKETEQSFDLRVHMQLAGPRDRAKIVDGYDICGLRLCCSSWMTQFPKVGIRMAKDQDLSLNPDKISGVCGRLLCCLTFEYPIYREMRGTLPKVGKRVSTPAGMGKVIKLNVIGQTATLVLDDHNQRVDVPAHEIGLAVRVEEAPNEALRDNIDTEQARERRPRSGRPETRTRTEERPAVDGSEEGSGSRRRRRRRRRGGGGDDRAADAPREQAESPERPTEGAPQKTRDGSPSEGEARPRRRRRRRRSGGGAGGGSSSGEGGGTAE